MVKNMQTRPEQPPEGKLIAAAAERLSLSIREAARRAGISYGRWRQITTGYQNTSPGEFAIVRAPAKTLAKMAKTVGVTPEDMETVGQRPDAAEIMRREEIAAAPPRGFDDGSQFSLFGQLPKTLVEQVFPDYLLIAGRAEAAAAAHGGLVPAGGQVFPRDPSLAAQWDDLAGQVRDLGMFPSDETLIHRIAETMALAWSVQRGRQGGQSAGPVAAG